nr:MAG TPA: hypothetical protein [Caudoviricetes sp.]
MYPSFFFLAFLPCMASLLCYRSASPLFYSPSFSIFSFTASLIKALSDSPALSATSLSFSFSPLGTRKAIVSTVFFKYFEFAFFFASVNPLYMARPPFIYMIACLPCACKHVIIAQNNISFYQKILCIIKSICMLTCLYMHDIM